MLSVNRLRDRPKLRWVLDVLIGICLVVIVVFLALNFLHTPHSDANTTSSPMFASFGNIYFFIYRI
ncbi:unnamed protein product [Soboliphyme baturini]|uniref:Uncharacterized protein n=1 Tax=Soboliphyme baturini TaxID=241478 RepID=A0A183IL31_9BILA|nr:unnamed protein product [Soboliphyme baturini]